MGTLNTALTEEILITIIVVLIAVIHLKSSLLISSLLPLAVLMCFMGMRVFKVDANIVALSGIAIAIGTMVDMGIIICENILKKIEHAEEGASRLKLVYEGTSEVGSAVMTAVATTIVSFMPVFAMDGAEGKLFKPLAYTKTFALLASIIVALTILPPMAELLFTARKQFLKNRRTYITAGLYLLCGIAVSILLKWWAGLFFIYVGVKHLILPFVPEKATNTQTMPKHGS